MTEDEGKKKGMKLLLVDFPWLINQEKRYHLYQLFYKLSEEFDEIACFAQIPKYKRPEDEINIWGAIRIAAACGAFPTLYPSDVDPFLVTSMYRSHARKEVTLIGILSGDQGYYEAIKDLKRSGKKIKLIVNDACNYYLLRSLADEVSTLDEYAEVINNAIQPEIKIINQKNDIHSNQCSNTQEIFKTM